MRGFLLSITRDPISLLGVAITTASAMLIVSLFAIELIGFIGNPYVGILAYMILPAIFLAGLLLIPVGVFRHRRRERRAVAGGAAPEAFPIINLNVGRTRRVVLTFIVLTLANLVILATVTYKGVEVMESTEFCGTTCHTVMQPEHTAHAGSPHSRVRCVECHIGPGADWFVKSKLSGAWQVVSVAFDLYPKPIPSPIHDLRPARETCEQCHWPTKFVGDRLKVLTRYSEDEPNTETKTVLLLRVGGIQGRESQGIHWHVDPANRIRYRTDSTREVIHDVELTRPDGTTTVYRVEGSEPAGELEWRTMDCVDCHNRPTHIYDLPDAALDEAIEDRRIDRSLPFVRREGLELLQASYPSHEAARDGLSDALEAYYRSEHPEVLAANADSVAQAGRALGDIWTRNVFPSMNVTWGTYPDHIGHEQSPGCFRCHDDEHAAEDGTTISQDCFTCHSLLAMEEEDPEILQMLQP